MQIHLVAVGTRLPTWVQTGFDEYARRLPRECRLALHEIPLGKRSKRGDRRRAVDAEGEQMLRVLRPEHHVVALEVEGQTLSTAELASKLGRWLEAGHDHALLVGGPDGLARSCRERADSTWSLSPLTLPHGLVRVLVAEQLYRAWTILRGHPYHRA